MWTFFPEEHPHRRVRKANVIEVVAKYEARLKEDLGWLNPMGYLKANHLGTPQYC